MGNIKSCCLHICPPNKEDEDEYNERTRILADPTDGTLSEDNYTHLGGSLNGEKYYGSMDEDSRNEQNNNWERTLHKMAVNLIDVSTAYVPTVEYGELLERKRFYQTRLTSMRSFFTLRSRQNRLKRQQTRRNEQVDYKRLAHVTNITDDDMDLICDASERIADAFHRGFVVQTHEQLLVEFDP